MAGKTRNIDGKKLEALIYARNFTLATAGEEIGRSRGLFAQAIKNGYISEQVIEQVAKGLDIKYEQYQPDSEKPAPQPKPEAETRFTTMDEQLVKTLIAMQGQANNNMTAIYNELREIKELLKAVVE